MAGDDVTTLLLLVGRPEQEKCLLIQGTPGPFTLVQAPLDPSAFLFLKGLEPAGPGRVRHMKVSLRSPLRASWA